MEYEKNIKKAVRHLKDLDYDALSEVDRALGNIHKHLPEFWIGSGCRDIQIENTKLLSKLSR